MVSFAGTLVAAFAFPAMFVLPYWPECKDEIFVSLPYIGVYFKGLVGVSVPSSGGAFREVTTESSVESLLRMLVFYFPTIFVAAAATVSGAVIICIHKKRIQFLRDYRYAIYMALLFFGNLLVHVHGALNFCPGCVVPYFNYFILPGVVLAAVFMHFLYMRISGKVGRALLAVSFVALVLVGVVSREARIYLLTWNDQFGSLKKGAERLAFHTGKEDKIFALSDIHVFFLADRSPYASQVNNYYSYVIGGDADQLLRQGRWNYEMALAWLKDADAVVLDEGHYRSVASIYTGLPGSGRELRDLMESVLRREFTHVDAIPGTQQGVLHIYLRRE